jgi:type IV pilus assembly protein PilW
MPRGVGLQYGLTLVELLVSVVISSFIVIAATSFFVGTSRSRDTQDAAALLEDNARFATDLITRNLQQAGFQNYQWDANPARQALIREVIAAGSSDGEPDIRGYNNSATGSDLDQGAHDRATARVNNSDTLVVRFHGANNAAGSAADGSMIDCLGRSQPATTSVTDRVFSIFEVRQTGSEPELYCKYKASSGFSREVIVRGVESFQVMYGVDNNADSFVDKWLDAKQVDALSANALNAWARVRSVRVGMVMRSPNRVALASSAGSYKPLGDNFTSSSDTGSTLTVSDDGRLRRVVTFTVNLRNNL